MSSASDAFVVYYKRTAFSRSRPNSPEKDVFNPIRMDYALSLLISDAVSATGIRPQEIDDVITGCAYQRDENWTFGGRHPVLLAHMPSTVPSMAVDRACSSSLNALSIGAMEIMTGNADIVLAGGFEHMTHVPRLSNRLCDALLEDESYKQYDMRTGYYMGLTAEKLAEKAVIGREEMDEFALRSHRLAARSYEEGYMKEEILPLRTRTEEGENVIDTDQSIRKDTSIEKLSALPPAFKENGLITAGNSSPLNAGASLVMLMSRRKLEECGLESLSRVSSIGWAAVDPSIMGAAIVPAVSKALSRAGIGAKDVDLWEINEAFSVVVLNAVKELGIDVESVNVRGGAVSLGHPLGASGTRIAGTLSRMLGSGLGEVGVASLCVGGGQGYAVVFER